MNFGCDEQYLFTIFFFGPRALLFWLTWAAEVDYKPTLFFLLLLFFPEDKIPCVKGQSYVLSANFSFFFLSEETWTHTKILRWFYCRSGKGNTRQ